MKALRFFAFICAIIIPFPALALTTVTRYVNTASTAGGDGTTNNTAGATRAYASLQGAITAEVSARADLVSRDELLDIICEGSTADSYSGGTNSVTVDGFTTDATRLVRIRTTQANRHDGKWNTSKYRISSADSYSGIYIKDAYVELDGLQVEMTGSGTGALTGIRALEGEGSLSLKLTNSIIRFTGDQTGASGCDGANNALRFRPDVANVRLTLVNNIFYGFEGCQVVAYSGGYQSGEINIVYNNTMSGGYGAIAFHGAGSSDALYFKNNLMQGCGTTCYAEAGGSFTTNTHSDNVSSDATSPDTSGCSGGGTCRSKTATFAGTGDYHLSASDTEAKDLGTDLSADAQYAFSTDIDGNTRSGSWDIGADEYQSSGPSLMLILNANGAN